MASLPYGAMPQDTAEFMLGTVAVTPVFLESDGRIDTSTEDWTPELIQETLQKVQEGVEWWEDLLAEQQSVHTLEFVIDTSYAVTPVETAYEPISRVSNDFALWVQEFVTGVGFDTAGGLDADIRAFNHAQRLKLNTHWAFTMFIVNSDNDLDGAFKTGGSFPHAFAFAGGLFLVSPSSRPASTFAHESGHIFWGKDEYPGGGSYTDRRGYYNAQNVNAADNPTDGFVQQPSIMAAGTLLDQAYIGPISPPSTLAMIGWRDSDEDGIFDVLDVPLELTGIGYLDHATNVYRFVGSAKVGVLPNQNSEGLRNDITLNRVSSIQYRIDDGNWTTFEEPDVYEAELDLRIPLPSSWQTIELRAVDAPTGVTSNVFHGRADRADAVVAPGINGFVWIDHNGNGVRDAGEFGEAGWTVQVLSTQGVPITLQRLIDPDALPIGELDLTLLPGISITAYGSDTDGRVGVFNDSTGSTNGKLFRAYSRASQSWSSSWTTASRRMRVELATPSSVVEIDAIGISSESYGRIEAFDAAENLLDRFTTSKLASGDGMTMRVESAAGAIASIRVGGHANTSVRLDNLRIGPVTKMLTNDKGQYAFPGLPTGAYTVEVHAPANRHSPLVIGGHRQAATVSAGSVTNDVDFGFSAASSWQNPVDHLDVNDDGIVAALDVLLVVNVLNAHGPRVLPIEGEPPPFIDVNGDGLSSALDALWIVNHINLRVNEAVIAEAEADEPLVDVRPRVARGNRSGFALPLSTGAVSSTVARDAGALAHDEALLAIADPIGRFESLPIADLDGGWRRRERRLLR